ncbi:helix-turn-helix transcriptional regulator [Ralstonia pseudosolanacearum]
MNAFFDFFGHFMTIAPFTPMTKDDVAAVLGVSIRTIENLVKANQMPAPGRIGGRVLWHPDVFYSWLDMVLRIPGPVDDEAAEPDEVPTNDGLESNAHLGAPRKATPRNGSPPKSSAVQRMRARQARKLQMDDLDEVS